MVISTETGSACEQIAAEVTITPEMFDSIAGSAGRHMEALRDELGGAFSDTPDAALMVATAFVLVAFLHAGRGFGETRIAAANFNKVLGSLKTPYRLATDSPPPPGPGALH